MCRNVVNSLSRWWCITLTSPVTVTWKRLTLNGSITIVHWYEFVEFETEHTVNVSLRWSSNGKGRLEGILPTAPFPLSPRRMQERPRRSDKDKAAWWPLKDLTNDQIRGSAWGEIYCVFSLNSTSLSNHLKWTLLWWPCPEGQYWLLQYAATLA